MSLTTTLDPERDPFVSLASTNIPLMYEWFHHELSIIASPSGEMFDDTARFVCTVSYVVAPVTNN